MKDKPKVGRPKGSGAKLIDIEQLKQWARAGATLPEMAQRLGVSLATLNRRLELPKFRGALDIARAEMLTSLRSKQVALALAGNVTMLIWLGKQYLGQQDKLQHSGTGLGGAILVSDAKDELKAKLDALSGRIADGADRSAPSSRPN